MKLTLVFLSLGLGLAGCKEPSGHAPADHAAPAAAAATNPVQAEMVLLTSTLQLAVDSIGRGDVRPIAHELHKVHAAKQATEAAIRDGKYVLGKNPDRLDRFRELDEAFHGDLGRLVGASQANDVPGAAAALGSVLGSCHGCHSEFRQ